MNAGTSTERQVRTQHRHELRTLSYLTVEQTNGGVVRNLNQYGIGVQMVAALRPHQQVRIRFELRAPRLRVEMRGEVAWGTFSGQCGIRFLDLSVDTRRKINEWILGDLLEGISLHAERTGAMFGGTAFTEANASQAASHANLFECVEGELDCTVEEDDGLLISGPAPRVIPLPVRRAAFEPKLNPLPQTTAQDLGTLDWLSQPLSPRGIAWTIDVLVCTAALLMFALIFLSVIGDAPRWPIRMAAVGAASVAIMYWGFFWVFGGKSLGKRLARSVGITPETRKQTETEGQRLGIGV